MHLWGFAFLANLENIVPIPNKLIESAKSQHFTDTLCYWVKLKSIGTIYDYNTIRVSDILRISPTTSSKHMKKMFALGLVHMRGKNLVCSSITRLKKLGYTGYHSHIRIFKKKRQNKLSIYASLIGRKLENQKLAIAKKSKLIKNIGSPKITKKQYKYFTKYFDGNLAALRKSHSSETLLSNKTIGEELSVSLRTASKYQNEMHHAGIITKRANLRLICRAEKSNAGKVVSVIKGSGVIGSNRLVVIQGNIYEQRPNFITYNNPYSNTTNNSIKNKGLNPIA